MTRTILLALAVGAVLTGCGRQNQSPLHAIKGRVTFDGKPVSDGNVSFYPENAAFSPAGARLGEDGNYSLQLAPGIYEVRIVRLQAPANTNPNAAGGLPVPVSLTKEGLKEEITGPKELNFDLKP